MSKTADWATDAAAKAFRGHAMDDYDDIIAATAAALRKERERCAQISASDRALNGRRTLSSQRIEAAIRALNIPKGD